MADIISAKFEFGDLLASLDRFESVVQQKVLFTGAATMARVIYDEVKLNTSRYTHVGLPGGYPGLHTGTLHENIYWTKVPEETSPGKVTYVVSFRKGGGIKGRAHHGYLIEYGHWFRAVKGGPALFWVAPRPFLRPSMSKMPQAINAGLVNMTVKFSRELGL